MAHLQLQCRSGVSWHEHKSAQLAAAPDGSAVARHRKSKRDATEISFQGLLDDLAHAMIKPMHALDRYTVVFGPTLEQITLRGYEMYYLISLLQVSPMCCISLTVLLIFSGSLCCESPPQSSTSGMSTSLASTTCSIKTVS